jgi:riboflavin kinase/FMN adenylyltransferase
MGASLGFGCESLPTVAPDGARASSTRVREALAGGDMEAAARLLGRPYSISGRVVGGDRIGRTLGFPTANLQLQHNRPPVSGIFVVEAHGIDGRAWPGVASLGVRPTVTDSGRPVLEVFVLDFHGDLYGRRLRLDFLHKLRDEEKYPGLDQLRSAIAADVEAARHFHRQRHG